jgi:hypothetical protein
MPLIVCNAAPHPPGCICGRTAHEAWERVETLELQVKELKQAVRDVLEISEVEGAVNLTTMESCKLMAIRDLVGRESEVREPEGK